MKKRTNAGNQPKRKQARPTAEIILREQHKELSSQYHKELARGLKENPALKEIDNQTINRLRMTLSSLSLRVNRISYEFPDNRRVQVNPNTISQILGSMNKAQFNGFLESLEQLKKRTMN